MYFRELWLYKRKFVLEVILLSPAPTRTPLPLKHLAPILEPSFHLLGLKIPYLIQIQGHPGADSTRLPHTILQIVGSSKI